MPNKALWKTEQDGLWLVVAYLGRETDKAAFVTLLVSVPLRVRKVPSVLIACSRPIRLLA